AEAFLRVLDNYNLGGSVMVQSFDVRALQVLHQLRPTIKLGLLTEDLTPPEIRLQQLGFIPYAYNPHYRLLDSSLMQLLGEKSIKCFTWTVNDAVTVQNLIALQVDGIITDYPDLVLNTIRNTD